MTVKLRVAQWLIALGGLTYSSWWLAFIVPTGLSQHSAFASEYEASGHPWAWLFRGADLLSGLSLGIGATIAVVITVQQGRSWALRVMLAATAVIGYSTAITGALPVDCSSSNGQCTALRATGATRTWHDLAHHAISNGSGSAFTIALTAMVVAVLLGHGGPAARRWVIALVMVSTFTSIIVDELLWNASQRGIPQRIDEAGEMLFFLVVAYDLGRVPAGGWSKLINAWHSSGQRARI